MILSLIEVFEIVSKFQIPNLHRKCLVFEIPLSPKKQKKSLYRKYPLTKRSFDFLRFFSKQENGCNNFHHCTLTHTSWCSTKLFFERFSPLPRVKNLIQGTSGSNRVWGKASLYKTIVIQFTDFCSTNCKE